MPEENNKNDEPFVQGGDHQFLEPGEHDPSCVDHDMKIQVGEKEENVYTEEGRESLVEDDEIEPWEEGFSEGADHEGSLGTCAHCDKVLGEDKGSIVEKEYDGEVWFFCSEGCAKAGIKR